MRLHVGNKMMAMVIMMKMSYHTKTSRYIHSNQYSVTQLSGLSIVKHVYIYTVYTV